MHCISGITRHKVHWRHSRQPSMKAWNTDTTGGTAIHLLTAFGSNASVAHCQCWEALTWLPLLPRTTSCAQTLRQVSSYDPSRPKFHAGNPKGRICSNEQLFETMTVVWQPCGNSSATALAGCNSSCSMEGVWLPPLQDRGTGKSL